MRWSARVATAADRELALRWWIAFGDEVLHEGGPGRDRAEATLDHRLSSPSAGILLWENAGEPVSIAGWGGPTPNGIRIGPVYTPAECRGRGYGSAVTAAVTQDILDDGAIPVLFTDLANPTSNKIYQLLGYYPVADRMQVTFTPLSSR